jgi:uncharacterized coiled-coil protein SlyX
MKTTLSLLLIALLLACFALSPVAQAVSPAPDGGYPGGNTAEGQTALLSLTTGGFNTGVGYLSLRSNTTNSFNTAIGAGALLANTADSNTATGAGALLSNTVGSVNTAIGAFVLFSNNSGSDNSAFGWEALGSNTSGGSNTAIGDNALSNNVTGSNNSALGAFAGSNVTSASNVICIGHSGLDASNTTWIANVYGVTTISGIASPVFVSNTGQLGTITSSERFKKDIAAMEKASEAILSLRPVTFHYKTDTKGTPQFGLIAEEVAKVNPALVLPDKEGKPFTVRYDQVNAMLLNEFLKEHKKVEQQQANIAVLNSRVAKQEAIIAQQQKGMEAVTARLDEQAAQIQKVSAQIEITKPAPQTIVNNH